MGTGRVFFSLAVFASVSAAFRQSLQGLYPGNHVDPCPDSCSQAGPNPANWTRIHLVEELGHCKKPLLIELHVHNSINDSKTDNVMRVCVPTEGETYQQREQPEIQFRSIAAENATVLAKSMQVSNGCGAKSSTVLLQVRSGNASNGSKTTSASDISSAAGYLADYLQTGASCGYTILFAKAGDSVVGLFSGSDVQKAGAARLAREFQKRAQSGGNSFEVCDKARGGSQSFGLFAAPLGDLATIQDAVKTWSSSSCLDASRSAAASTPEDLQVTLLVPFISNSTLLSNGTLTNATSSANGTFSVSRLLGRSLRIRDTCKAVEVVSGDGCGSLASRCGISGDDLAKYNSKRPDLCATLMPRQFVCCGPGDLPDPTPQHNPDGTCFVYVIRPGDVCWDIADAHYLTSDKIEDFNRNTWGWAGCSALQPNQPICLSKGKPPMPKQEPTAQCGPQVLGTERPSNGSSLADLNPCPLNACCDDWGFCGTTSKFCTISKSPTGAPGTHASGQNGCISNCGTNITNNSKPPASFRSIGYFEAWNFNRACLFMDVEDLQDPGMVFTHIHFAFGTITPEFQITMGNDTQDQFSRFAKLDAKFKKIVSFGGWAFSTELATYNIFRQGTAAANRATLAQNVVNFVNSNNLDGVDFDWEYPGEPDIQGPPAGGKDEGQNYLEFLKLVRGKLDSSKSVSIALPASYWYLKQFPVNEMQQYVDYFIYMTYDLHGQWDYGNNNSVEGCDNGNCARSHVNLTETENALSMLTKAGVSSTKIMMGVSSYGRGFRLEDPGCDGTNCRYTGSNTVSNARKGECTDTGGYISDAEIRNIIQNSNDWPHFKSYHDDASASDILIYGDDSGTDWVGWMNTDTKRQRAMWARARNIGGTTDWAVDLETWTGRSNDPDDDGLQWPETDTSCDPAKRPKTLEDLSNAAGSIEPSCWDMYALSILQDDLSQALTDYQNAVGDYDNNFGYYADYIKDSIDPRLQGYMAFGKGDGNKFFDCTYKSGASAYKTVKCTDMDSFWEAPSGGWDVTYKLRDEQGFFDALDKDLGIQRDWVTFGDWDEGYSCEPDPNGHTGGGPGGSNGQGGGSGTGVPICHEDLERRHGFPMKGGDIKVTSPKDIIVAAHDNITALQHTMFAGYAQMRLATYDANTADAVIASAMPVFMIQEAVASMKEIISIGQEEGKKKKEAMILLILNIVLMVIPFVGEGIGGVFGGAAAVGRAASLISEAGNAAVLTYEITKDPASAPFLILGYLVGMAGGGKRPPEKFKDASDVRKLLKPEQLQKFSDEFQKKDGFIQKICSACATARRG